MEGAMSVVTLKYCQTDLTFLRSIAGMQLKYAEKELDGQKFRCLVPSMAFSIFSIEAVINHYGAQLHTKRLFKKFKGKTFYDQVEALLDKLSTPNDIKEEVLPSIRGMINFRNMLVHMKTQITSIDSNLPPQASTKQLMYNLGTPDNEYSVLELCTFENAKKYLDTYDNFYRIVFIGANRLGIDLSYLGEPIKILKD
jgi:hypothetical protein